MTARPLNSPRSLRQDAERCFRLAETLMNQRDQEALLEYGRELLKRAERMEAAVDATEYSEVASC